MVQSDDRNSPVPKKEATGASPSVAGGNNRVYVGNLAWKTEWQDLKDHMRGAGGQVVRADIFVDGEGRSRGCGIVEFATADQAADAIEQLTDTELMDRKIFVREDREGDGDNTRSRKPMRGAFRGGRDVFRGGYNGRGNYYSGSRNSNRRGRGNYYGGRNNAHLNNYSTSRQIPEECKDCQIFVGNLAWKVNWRDLKDLFREVGEVVRADVYERDGRSQGCGTVLFKTPEEAYLAIEKFNEIDLDGRQIAVRMDHGPPGRKDFQ